MKGGRPQLTTEDFIRLSREKHGNKYDYSKVEYTTSKEKVCIICPIHGEFWQVASYHYREGKGCPKCGLERTLSHTRSNTEDFIRKAKEIHGEKYDYSRVDYKNNHTKVIIGCPIHGWFEQLPMAHLSGSGCNDCGNEITKIKKTKSQEEFIEECKKMHSDIYDLSKVEYKGSSEKICVICEKHGEFWISASSFLSGRGCPQCGKERQILSQTYTTDDFVRMVHEVHGDKYEYDLSTYNGWNEKMRIICNKHGEFWQRPIKHIGGHQGCPICANEIRNDNNRLTTKEFIQRAQKVHGNKYDYSKLIYENYKTSVLIICPKHGEFWQKPNDHFKGSGCPICGESRLEGTVRKLLSDNDIEFISQKSFDWLKSKSHGVQKLDFYLPKQNIAIECQGIQHFKPVDHFGGEESFKRTVERDQRKLELCKMHGVDILYFADDTYSKEGIITSLPELLKEIRKYDKY